MQLLPVSQVIFVPAMPESIIPKESGILKAEDHSETQPCSSKCSVTRIEDFSSYRRGNCIPIGMMDGKPEALPDRICPPVLGAMRAHIAIVDGDGEIAWTNRAWQTFSWNNSGNPTKTGVGVNYLAVCKKAEKDNIQEAALIRNRILRALAGKVEDWDLEYPCHSPMEKRWFVASIFDVCVGGSTYLAVCMRM